jgi:hypothetical protein
MDFVHQIMMGWPVECENSRQRPWVRRGAESARVLADELARIVEQAEG